MNNRQFATVMPSITYQYRQGSKQRVSALQIKNFTRYPELLFNMYLAQKNRNCTTDWVSISLNFNFHVFNGQSSTYSHIDHMSFVDWDKKVINDTFINYVYNSNDNNNHNLCDLMMKIKIDDEKEETTVYNDIDLSDFIVFFNDDIIFKIINRREFNEKYMKIN